MPKVILPNYLDHRIVIERYDDHCDATITRFGELEPLKIETAPTYDEVLDLVEKFVEEQAQITDASELKFTPTLLTALEGAHRRAEAAGLDEFEFQGCQVHTGYAKYLIQYPTPILGAESIH